jgi:hypothetical protein
MRTTNGQKAGALPRSIDRKSRGRRSQGILVAPLTHVFAAMRRTTTVMTTPHVHLRLGVNFIGDLQGSMGVESKAEATPTRIPALATMLDLIVSGIRLKLQQCHWTLPEYPATQTLASEIPLRARIHVQPHLASILSRNASDPFVSLAAEDLAPWTKFFASLQI